MTQSSEAIDKNHPVCVTGASGFIASHLCSQLLEAGYRVRGTVRKTAEDYPHLTALPGAKDRLELVKADLLTPGAFDKAVVGCSVVMHTASPYALNVADAQRDLVDPAVQGTKNLLSSCAKTEGIRRVVLTSSVAAITDEPDPNRVYNEEDWNEKSSLTRNPYYYSKTLAERAAWDFMAAETRAFDLVTINPFLVIGPSMTRSLNTSNKVILDALSGAFPAIIDLAWGIVDVRDVAAAHVRALESPSASGRHLCANKTLTMRQLVGILRELGYGAYKLPSLGLESGFGTAVVKLGSYFQPRGVGTYLRTHIGKTPRFDNSKIREELGLEFRSIDGTIDDTVKDLIRWTHLAAAAVKS